MADPVLNKENAQKWITALRSGDYVQAQAVLRKPNTNEMCCLGVLCDLYSKFGDGYGTWQGRVQKTPFKTGDVEGQVYSTAKESFGFAVMPPSEVKVWSGLGISQYNSFWGMLAEKNDGGATFEEIATMIEERLVEEEAKATTLTS